MKHRIWLAYATTALLCAASSFAQQHFDSPDDAAQAAIDAAGDHDATKLAAIFGPQGHAVLTSGNPVQDQADQSEFAQLARAKHQVKTDPRNPNRALLSIGALDWPFPIPLVRANGKWSFDPSQSKVEMEARRIGTHELDAIEICAGYVEAQHKYASETHDKDGLMAYATNWDGTAAQFVPKGFSDAFWDGTKHASKPYHGYYFRLLDGQGAHAPGGEHTYRVKNKLIGGFGLVAWPAQYGVTGVHTFIVNQDGIVYQKDMGQQAAEPLMKRFDPDPSWARID